MYEHLNKVVSVVKKSIAHRPLFTINFTVYKGIQSNHMFLCTHRELLNHLLLSGSIRFVALGGGEGGGMYPSFPSSTVGLT